MKMGRASHEPWIARPQTWRMVQLIARARPAWPPGAPAEIAQALECAPALPSGDGERFSGYGVMGLPFASGHYLALRRFPASSIGPAYSSVWWREPGGAWVIFSDAPAELSCARYVGNAVDAAHVRQIQLVWRTPRSLSVVIADC